MRNPLVLTAALIAAGLGVTSVGSLAAQDDGDADRSGRLERRMEEPDRLMRIVMNRRARLGIARTFQVSNLFRSLTVSENILLAAQARRPARWSCVPRLGVRGAVRETDRVIDQLLLGGRRHDRVENLSHGERRQLEIAMALVVAPRLLLLDEPAAGLSLVERRRLREILEGLPRTVPFLLIEHDLSLALELADRVVVLDNGRMIAAGSADEIRRDRHVREVYLGRTAS